MVPSGFRTGTIGVAQSEHSTFSDTLIHSNLLSSSAIGLGLTNCDLEMRNHSFDCTQVSIKQWCVLWNQVFHFVARFQGNLFDLLPVKSKLGQPISSHKCWTITSCDNNWKAGLLITIRHLGLGLTKNWDFMPWITLQLYVRLLQRLLCQYKNMVRNQNLHRGTSIQLQVHWLSINQYWHDQFFTSFSWEPITVNIGQAVSSTGSAAVTACSTLWIPPCFFFLFFLLFLLSPPLAFGARFSGHFITMWPNFWHPCTAFRWKYFPGDGWFYHTWSIWKSSLHFLNIMEGTMKSWGFFFR